MRTRSGSLKASENKSGRLRKKGQRGTVIGKKGDKARIEFDPPAGVWQSEPSDLTTSPQMDLRDWEECPNGWYSQDCANLNTVGTNECEDNPKSFVCQGASWSSKCSDEDSSICDDSTWGACWRKHCKAQCGGCKGSGRRLGVTNLPEKLEACVGECSEEKDIYMSCCGCPQDPDNAGNTFSWTAVLGLIVALQLLF